METATYTPDEADAMLMKEAGLSLYDVSCLNLYWKRLMLGYKEPKAVTPETFNPMKLMMKARGAAAGGWRTM